MTVNFISDLCIAFRSWSFFILTTHY
jgi:hypothetical protein